MEIVDGAVMRDLFVHPTQGQSPDGKWNRIKVCFLPDDLDKKQLRRFRKTTSTTSRY